MKENEEEFEFIDYPNNDDNYIPELDDDNLNLELTITMPEEAYNMILTVLPIKPLKTYYDDGFTTYASSGYFLFELTNDDDSEIIKSVFREYGFLNLELDLPAKKIDGVIVIEDAGALNVKHGINIWNAFKNAHLYNNDLKLYSMGNHEGGWDLYFKYYGKSNDIDFNKSLEMVKTFLDMFEKFIYYDGIFNAYLDKMVLYEDYSKWYMES